MDHFLPPDNNKFNQPGWNPTSTDSMFATIVHDLREKGAQLDRIEKNMDFVKTQNQQHDMRIESLEVDRENVIQAGKGVGKFVIWIVAGFCSALGAVGTLIAEKYVTKWF